MRHLQTVHGWLSDNLLPLAFAGTNLVNLVFFYLGLAFEENSARTYGFMLLAVLFAVVAGVMLLWSLRGSHWSKLTWLLLIAVPVFYIACFAVSFLKYGIRSVLVSNVQQFVVLALPMYFAGIFAARKQKLGVFLERMEEWSFLALPAAAIYTHGALANCNPFNYGRDLGILGYMTLAYTFLPFLLTHILQFADGAPLRAPFAKKSFRHPQIVRGVLIAYYWLAIITSGTRGAYVCVAVFCVLMVVSRLIHKTPLKRGFFVSAALAAVLLFNMFIYAPPGMYGVHRMDMFLSGLKEGQIVTSSQESAGVKEEIDELVQAESGQQIANFPEEGKEEQAEENTEGNTEETIEIGNRGTLYQLAVKEFLKSPLTGMGAGGYTIKYGKYPHNVILELFCETGLVGAIPYLLLVLLVFVKFIVASSRDKNVRYFLLFLMAYVVQANISGTVWNCGALLCALGYGIAMPRAKSLQKNAGISKADQT